MKFCSKFSLLTSVGMSGSTCPACAVPETCGDCIPWSSSDDPTPLLDPIISPVTSATSLITDQLECYSPPSAKILSLLFLSIFEKYVNFHENVL